MDCTYTDNISNIALPAKQCTTTLMPVNPSNQLNCESNVTRTVTTVPSVMTVTSEIKCYGPRHGKVDNLDFTRDAVPPNEKRDILILTDGIVRDMGEMLFQRIARFDMWFIYISITIIYIMFVVSALSGINSIWYNNLTKSNVNPWVIGILWAFSTLLSYGAIFMIWEHVQPNEVSFDMILSIYFLIGTFLSLLWAAVFFHNNNITFAVWTAALMFLYQFWLLIYIWSVKIRAAIFMIPIVILYGYILYSMIHLATLNNIII